MDKAKIVRLCSDIEYIVNELAAMCEIIDRSTHSEITDIIRKIIAEISEPPKSNGDRIRQMTDEELVEDIGLACRHCQYFNMKNMICTEPDKDCTDGNLEWLKQEVSEDDER